MRLTGKSTVIIVTSPQYTRGLHTLWNKLTGNNPDAAVHAAPDDPFAADHRWRNTGDALAVAHEILGLLNTWADFRCVRTPIEDGTTSSSSGNGAVVVLNILPPDLRRC
jgi:hypothetical protein